MSAAGSRPLLSRGDRVGVVATGFAVRSAQLRAGVRALERMGYEVVLGDHVLAQHGYLAGDDDARAADLRAMIADDRLTAIWFARGGYGTARLLDRVPWRALKRSPKLMIGYSDLTALFCPAVERAGCRCLHGPVVVELGRPESYHSSSLRSLLRGRGIEMRIRPRQVLASGRARGPLLGGNLSVLAHLQGTRYAPDLRGAVLFFEEVGEQAYRIDRALTQLLAAGALRDLAAVLVGRSSVPARRSFPPDRTLRDLLRERLGPLGIPIVTDLPVGHIPGKWSLPLGGRAVVQTDAGRLRFTP